VQVDEETPCQRRVPALARYAGATVGAHCKASCAAGSDRAADRGDDTPPCTILSPIVCQTPMSAGGLTQLAGEPRALLLQHSTSLYFLCRSCYKAAATVYDSPAP